MDPCIRMHAHAVGTCRTTSLSCAVCMRRCAPSLSAAASASCRRSHSASRSIRAIFSGFLLMFFFSFFFRLFPSCACTHAVQGSPQRKRLSPSQVAGGNGRDQAARKRKENNPNHHKLVACVLFEAAERKKPHIFRDSRPRTHAICDASNQPTNEPLLRGR